MVRIVCLSVCRMRISLKLSEIDVWLLGNSNRNPGFPIQNLPSDLRLEVQFCHFRCFWVAFSDKLYCKDGPTLGTVSSCPTTNDTLSCCYLFFESKWTTKWKIILCDLYDALLREISLHFGLCFVSRLECLLSDLTSSFRLQTLIKLC